MTKEKMQWKWFVNNEGSLVAAKPYGELRDTDMFSGCKILNMSEPKPSSSSPDDEDVVVRVEKDLYIVELKEDFYSQYEEFSGPGMHTFSAVAMGLLERCHAQLCDLVNLEYDHSRKEKVKSLIVDIENFREVLK